MFTDAALEFLRAPRFGYLASIGADGVPHNVPIWYDVAVAHGGGHDLVMIADRGSRKTRNLLARPQAALAVGGLPGDNDGYMVRGTVTVVDDLGQQATHAMIDRYEKGERNAALRALWADDNIVVLRLHPTSVTRVWG
jgi:PPOX class probable F420-dependent enzyme